MQNILVRPLVTEKITREEAENKYGFVVSTRANKISIAKAVEDKFNVKVMHVNTVLNKGKVKSQATKKGRFEGRTSTVKKAFVTLKSGDKIDVFGEI